MEISFGKRAVLPSPGLSTARSFSLADVLTNPYENEEKPSQRKVAWFFFRFCFGADEVCRTDVSALGCLPQQVYSGYMAFTNAVWRKKSMNIRSMEKIYGIDDEMAKLLGKRPTAGASAAPGYFGKLEGFKTSGF